MRINNILTKSIFIGLMALTFLGATERFKEELFKAMEYRNIGPFRGGRSAASTGVPGNKFLAYFGATGGGVWKTENGGQTWNNISDGYFGGSIGAVTVSEWDPNVIYVGGGEVTVRGNVSHGDGVWKSTDAGENWTHMGLDKTGRISRMIIHPTNPDVVYAASLGHAYLPQKERGIYRTKDGGKNWKLVSYNRHLAGRTAYYSRCAVSPDDPDEVYFLAAAYSITKDGGHTSEVVSGAGRPNWDHHDMWIDPSNSDRMAVAGDGGISISNNRGKTWFRVQLPVAQLYHVNVDNNVPYYVYANRQDGPSTRGPSRSRTGGFFGGGISRGMWHSVGGGESGFATPDPIDPDIIWSSASGYGAVGGIVVHYNERRRQFRQVEVWPEATFGSPAADIKYRFQWTFPLLISPHDNNTVYVTSQYVHRTNNGGQSWELASPDLSTGDKSKMGISGGLTPDNIGVEYCCVIYAFDESPVEKGVLWAGTNDGLVHVSRDNGNTWKDVTDNIPGLPPLGTVRNIDASKWDGGKAYITVDFHQVGNFDPYIYKTENYGRRWKKITRGIPSSTLSYTRNVREDPVRPGLLYLGTENSLYVSFNDGDEWQPLMNNMPASPMYWIVIQEEFNDLVVGTYGRGIWIMDDITPLQQLNKKITSSAAYLFEPRKAYRFRPITSPFTMFDDPSAGENPPYGASLNYWLKESSEDSVSIKISDQSGNLIRTLKGPSSTGINRVWWDFCLLYTSDAADE